MRHGMSNWGKECRAHDGGGAACEASNVAQKRLHAASHWCLLAALQAARAPGQRRTRVRHEASTALARGMERGVCVRDGDVQEQHSNVAQSRGAANHGYMPLTLRVCAMRGTVDLGGMSNMDTGIR